MNGRAHFVMLLVGVAGVLGCGTHPAAPVLDADLFVTEEAGPSAENAIRPLLEDARRSGSLPAVTVDYPLEGSVFPPEIVSPTFLWHDPDNTTGLWLIDVSFGTSPHHLYCLTRGVRTPAEIDPRVVTDTNVFHESGYQISARAWTPDERVWTLIKGLSTGGDARVTILGVDRREAGGGRLTSRGGVALRTSTDPVGARIFYRDVPLMPTETKEGVVQPLKQEALPLIQWRLRDLSKPAAPVVMGYLPTCGNCHSFSRDARVMSMDIDGPDGDKGAHVVKDVTAHMIVGKQDVFTWNRFRGPLGEYSFGMFPQVSPDGRHIIATVHEAIYVQNYMDYGFLQTFYPTRGVLAFYTRATGEIKTLSGADDRRLVQTNAVWSPDGKTIVFLRAPARDPYDGGSPAAYANDPREKQIQFDLYRVPFNGGRGGAAEPLAGASNNGTSNTFPKFSPDGKWIVFVRCKNGMLMRPDGKLYIMPAGGGTPRLMTCNTSRMNSWHSWSPNSRWLVFSSKINTPYTQMFLTHVDEEGNDTPAILIPNATAANRAVNLPEFAAIPPGGLEDITTPAVDYRRHMEAGRRLADQWRLDEAIAEFKVSLQLKADYPDTYAGYGAALARKGKLDEAVTYFRKALDIDPGHFVALVNLGAALSEQGKLDEALVHYRRALQINPDFPAALYSVGSILRRQGKPAEGIPYFDRAVKLDPGCWVAHYNWGTARVQMGSPDAAVDHFTKVIELNPAEFNSHGWLGGILLRQGRPGEAVRHYRKAIELNPEYAQAIDALARILATHAAPTDRDGKESVRLAEIACAKTGQADPQMLDTLACAYAETGRFDDAVRTVEKAIGLARSAKNEALAAGLQAHLALFQKQQPFHE